MSNAPRRQDAQDGSIPYLEPDLCEEPKTEPRIRMPLLIPTEQSGVVPRAQTPLEQAKRAAARFRFAPALVIGALIGSAPYLVQQHLRSRSVDDLRTLAHAADLETTQLATASAAAPQLYAAAALQQAEPALLPSTPQPLEAPSYIKDAADSSMSQQRAEHPKLTLERALLHQARIQLKHGDGLGAQLALQRIEKSVPHAALVQQRKLLEIQALLAIGAKDRARAAARDFAKAYPHSPKLAKLSGLLLGS